MPSLSAWIFTIWVLFWAYWLISAVGAKQGSRPTRARPPGLVIIVVVLLLHVFQVNGLVAHTPLVRALGAILFLAGLGLAVWARIYLGRNWGMPMTQQEEPELVTGGPYRFVRHPIYSGILLGVLGTALAVNVFWLIAFAVMGAYFIYSARVEEKFLVSSFPATYPGYRARTKMLVPFVL
jgi:protein-S-isoprenylcysteine O-methyltransferase Ste14